MNEVGQETLRRLRTKNKAYFLSYVDVAKKVEVDLFNKELIVFLRDVDGSRFTRLVYTYDSTYTLYFNRNSYVKQL